MDDEVVIGIVGLIIISLICIFCSILGYSNAKVDLINTLCKQQQYDFCIEEKNWRLKD